MTKIIYTIMAVPAHWINLTKRRRRALGPTYFELRPTGPAGVLEVWYKCRWAGPGDNCARMEPAHRFETLQSHETYSQSQRLLGLRMDDCPGERLN